MISLQLYAFIVLVSLISSIVIIYYINEKGYDKDTGNAICDNYVLTTYLYVALTFILIGTLALTYIFTKLYDKVIILLLGFNKILLAIIVIIYLSLYIGLITLLKRVNSKNKLAIHIIWVCLILLISISFGFSIMMGLNRGILLTVLSIVILITLITLIIGYKYGDKLLPYNFEKYLYYGLIMLIILGFLGPLIVGKNNRYFIMTLAVCGLILFILLMITYNNNLRKKKDICEHDENGPNFPALSFGLITKIINIFYDLIIILSNKKGSNRKILK